MKMQYELLGDGFEDRDAKASSVNLIKGMAGGTGAHRASALKFGLREGFSRVSSTLSQSRPTGKKQTSVGGAVRFSRGPQPRMIGA